ncbi:MAG: efflux RND transporter permease subunit [Tuberibacillus sp.]
MQNITKWSFKNRAAMIVLIVLVLIVGIMSYLRLPMELFPEADNPQVTVVTLAQGYNASSMTDAVTSPIENAVSSVKGKTNVFSTTGDGYSQINVSFDSDTDMKEAKQQISEAIASLNLPEGVSKPNIVQLNTDMIPIAEVGVTFDDNVSKAEQEDLYKEIIPKFQSIKGVGSVIQSGKANPNISIELDAKKLEQYHIPLHSVMSILQGQNLTAAVGNKTIDGKMTNIKVAGDLKSIDDLKNLVVPLQVPNAPVVQLKDIAEIKQSDGEQGITRLNGKDVLAFDITKDGNSSAVTVGNDIQKVVDQINKDYKNLHVENVFTTSSVIVDAVNGMLREVLLGALFATIIIVLFLRNLRSTLITIVSIPLSLGLTLYLLWQSGITLNVLTLGGVAVAVGRLVDDSIVVIENIFRRTERGGFTKPVIMQATGEVAKAITASTLTTVAVFLPMGLINGSLKVFILPFALTVTYSLLASLFVALTVVPLMSAWLLKGSKLPKHKEPRLYMKILRWNLNHKFVPILAAVVMCIGSISLYSVLPKGTMNTENASIVYATMTFPSDTPIEDVQEKGTSLEKKIMKLDGYENLFIQQGNSDDAAQYGSVSNPTQVSLIMTMEKGTNTDDFMKKVKEFKKDYPEASLDVTAGSFMGAQSTSITFDLVGKNEADLEKASKDVISAIDGVKNVKKVSSNMDEKKPVYSIVVDPSKANAQDVAMQLGMLLNPTPIGTINVDGKETKVLMNANINPESEDDLNKLQLVTQTGMVPVSSVAKIEKSEQTSTILHKDGDQYIRVTAEVDPEKLSVISQDIDKKLKKVDLPSGVELVKGGAVTQQSNDFADLGMTAAASIGLVYLIMVITFKSIRTPLAILMTLPLASTGAVLGLLISRVTVDPQTLLGGLMLIGVVVTNAIVLIDRVKQNQEKMPIREAIVEAAATRTRPILMTAVATICAMIPLLFAHAETLTLVSKGLAVVVIGGLALATVLTLVIVPVFYELFYFRKSKKQRMAAKENNNVVA